MSGGFGVSYLIVAAVLIPGFWFLRRWYTKDVLRAQALLLAMVALLFAPVLYRAWEVTFYQTGLTARLIVLVFVLPALFVAVSTRVRGYDKLGWMLISSFLSWVGFTVFLIIHGGRLETTRQG